MGALTETCARGNGTANKDKQTTHATGIATNNNVGSYIQLLPLEPAGPVDKHHEHTSKPLSFPVTGHSVMHQNGPTLFIQANEDDTDHKVEKQPPLVWDWPTEHEDRKREKRADAAMHGATPFEVDRRILKDVVREKMGVEVGRIKFLSAGTFHKAYLVTLADHVSLVARVARRFMPRLKTESEVATIHYLRQKTSVPVSTVYHYDSNPYNRLGGEFILMSKAPGIPLAQVYHGLPYNDLVKLLKNIAVIIIPLFAHRFKQIGSLYFGQDPLLEVGSGAPTPKATKDRYSAFPFSPTLDATPGIFGIRTPKPSSSHLPTLQCIPREFHVGPIISWPFFGSNRGDLAHPTELNRGPWATTSSYLESCVHRETDGVVRENEGKSAPHRLHLDPDEIKTSRHHRLSAVPGDESDESDEWNLSESEEEWEGPGDAMYRDYRRMQRSTFLVAHLTQREEMVKKEMGRWQQLMEKLMAQLKPSHGPEQFGIDCHDLSLENIFVDETDHTRVTCIIDWESTTVRPLWACAHVPAFLQSSPFLTKLFREIISQIPNDPTLSSSIKLPPSSDPLSALCRDWLYYESAGTRLRMAHRCAEWDGWEEGLVDSILGPEEFEDEWYRSSASSVGMGKGGGAGRALERDSDSARAMLGSPGAGSNRPHLKRGYSQLQLHPPVRGATGAVKLSSKLPMLVEQEKEQMLNTTGDICGGRGGELGRRLEAWLTVSGNVDVRGEERPGVAWTDGDGVTVNVETR